MVSKCLALPLYSEDGQAAVGKCLSRSPVAWAFPIPRNVLKTVLGAPRYKL